MSTLTFIEKQVICRLFGIGGGYVFSYYQGKDYNKGTTRDLILDACGIDIFTDENYKRLSQQKCIEKIWQECPPHIVAKLLDALCDYFSFRMGDTLWTAEDGHDYSTVREISERLKAIKEVELPQQVQGDLSLLVRDIETNIDEGTPELAIDRLHTFATQFFRDVCRAHRINVQDDKGDYFSLDGNVARLKKWYQSNNYFESEFCAVALQNTINIFSKYNDLRNQKSAAHPNTLLAKIEAEYAVKIIAATLAFVDRLEKGEETPLQDLSDDFMVYDESVDDFPF